MVELSWDDSTPNGGGRGGVESWQDDLTPQNGRGVVSSRDDSTPREGRGPEGDETPGAPTASRSWGGEDGRGRGGRGRKTTPHSNKPGAGARWRGRIGATGRDGEPRRWGQQRRQVLASPDPRCGSGRVRGSPRESKAGAGVRYKPEDGRGERHPEEHGRQPRRWGKRRH